MDGNDRSPIDLDLNSLRLLVDRNVKLLGEGWIERRVKKDEEERKVANGRNHQKNRVRQKARHLLVQWYREYLNVTTSGMYKQEIPLNQSVLLLATFCNNLGKAKDCLGITHILARLIKPEAFLAAAFEVEVATSYLNQGYQVAFIETGNDRSPDLKITTQDGTILWVECKHKDEMSERDFANEAFFDSLKDCVYKVWGPAKLNVALQVSVSEDPKKSELEQIVALILQIGRELTTDEAKRASPICVSAVDGKYQISLHFLAEPDVETIYAPIDKGGDYAEFLAEVCISQNGASVMQNPKVFEFRCEAPPDKYRTAVNSFNSAVGQLPDSGPGIIWIRVPFPSGYKRASEDLEEMAGKIQRELAGDKNRRVNAVILFSRWFSDAPNMGAEALTYRSALRVIEHRQPRCPIQQV